MGSTTLQVKLVQPPVAAFGKAAILLSPREQTRSNVRSCMVSVVRKADQLRGIIRAYYTDQPCLHRKEKDDFQGMSWWPARLVCSINEARHKVATPRETKPGDWLMQATEEGLPVTDVSTVALKKQPPYVLGQQVWAMVKEEGRDRVIETQVIAWNIDVAPGRRSLVGRLDSYCCGSGPEGAQDISLEDVFATEKEALFTAEFVAVSASREEWLTAIGDREDEDDDLMDCDLQIDGREVSAIRDTLIICQEQGGLNRRDVRLLQSQLNACWPPDGEIDTLTLILQQLGVTWEARPE